MLNKLAIFVLAFSFLVGSTPVGTSAQTLTTNALKIKAKAQERARDQSRTKVKLFSAATYVGVGSDAGDTSFTITDKGGSRHTVQYSEVKSIGGTGLGAGGKLGLGIAIGAGAVLGVLAAIIASND